MSESMARKCYISHNRIRLLFALSSERFMQRVRFLFAIDLLVIERTKSER